MWNDPKARAGKMDREELREENPARENCRYKVLGRGGHSLLDAKKWGSG